MHLATPRIKYAGTMRYKLQECYQMHVECISCAHMRSECAVLPTVRMHSMRGGIKKKLTYHGGELAPRPTGMWVGGGVLTISKGAIRSSFS